MSIDKIECPECYWIGETNDVLEAPHPFITDIQTHGCPACRCIVDFRLLCDEPGCLLEATMGTPMPSGYRNTCYNHAPK